jgi:hypothetical protein
MVSKLSGEKHDIPNFSELDQKKFKRNQCTCIKECDKRVSKPFFNQYCDTGAYIGCSIFAEKMQEINKPYKWLLKLYIEKGSDL